MPVPVYIPREKTYRKRRTNLVQWVNLVIVVLIFLTIIALVTILYQKYRAVKKKVRSIKRSLLSIIPKMRVHRYNNIKYPKKCPTHLLHHSSSKLHYGSKLTLLKGPPKSDDVSINTPISSPFNKDLAFLLDKFIKSAYNLSVGQKALLPSYAKKVASLGENGYVFEVTLESLENQDKLSLRALQKTYVIAYRGTNSREDVLTDIDFSQVPLDGNAFISDSENGVLCHEGFFRLWKEQKEAVAKLLSIIPTGANVVITGHSLGAALACFTALDLKHLLSSSCQIQLYLFAPPRVGNDRFVEMLNHHIPAHWAIINKRDVVTSLPPPVFSLFGSRWIYDDFQRIYQLNVETGSIIENHHLDTYIIGITGSKKDMASGTHIYWNRTVKTLI